VDVEHYSQEKTFKERMRLLSLNNSKLGETMSVCIVRMRVQVTYPASGVLGAVHMWYALTIQKYSVPRNVPNEIAYIY